MLALPDEVRIVEMLPRDGFQSLDTFVPTETKVEVIDRLSTTGIEEIEFTAFARPAAVPNLRDAGEVAELIERNPDVVYRALVPNLVGFERALEAGVDSVNALVAVSETYSRRNQNAERDAVINEIREIVSLARNAGVTVEAGVATSFYCPYEGRIPLDRTMAVIDAVVDAGVDTVTLATTMGLADPAQVDAALERVGGEWPSLRCGLHLHDTNGMGLANVVVALAHGVDRFDAAICGVGGGVVLPDSLEGVGNTPTEDLLHLLNRLGLCPDQVFDAVRDEAKYVSELLGVGGNSHVVRGGTADAVLDVVRRTT